MSPSLKRFFFLNRPPPTSSRAKTTAPRLQSYTHEHCSPAATASAILNNDSLRADHLALRLNISFSPKNLTACIVPVLRGDARRYKAMRYLNISYETYKIQRKIGLIKISSRHEFQFCGQSKSRI